MWWNLGVLVTARTAELRTSWRRFVCVAGRLSRRVTIVNFRINERSSNGAGSSLINSITNASQATNIVEAWLRNRRDICYANDRFLSKMTPRLRAESIGESMTLLSRWMVG